MKKKWLIFGMIAALLAQMTGPKQTAYIMQGELGRAINRTMRSGEERSGWEIELNQGRTVKKATWRSSDTSIMTVDGNNSGATVKTYKEGTAVLYLTVVTDQNETLTDDCLISSVTRLDASHQAEGYIKGSQADLHRGARTTSKVRNTASRGQKLTVIALCEGFYRVRLPESYEFNDTLDQDTAYVQKSKVEIPAASVSVTNVDKIQNLKVGDKVKASSSVMPELTTVKELVWESSDKTVATVDTDGMVTAKKAGNAVITLTEKHSGKKASVTVTVSDVFATSLTISNKDELEYLRMDRTATARVSLAPANVSKKNLVWKCDNAKVASVSKDGVIRGRMGGTATITVTDTYTGLSDSCRIRLLYQLAPAKATWRKIHVKKSTDFRGNHISWNKISGAGFYKIYIGTWNKKKGKYCFKSKKIRKNSYYDTNVAKGKKYKYYVKVYNKKGKKTHQSKAVKIRATAPELTLTVKSPSAMMLDWRPEKDSHRKGIKGYRIYRSTKKSGKYTCIKKLAGKGKYTWTDKTMKAYKEYYYKVCAYRKEKKKLKNGAYSNVVSGQTCRIGQSKNMTYFNGMKNTWKGVCIEQGAVSESQSRTKMNAYSVIQNDVQRWPHIKYHLTPETLYIHIYLEYSTYVKNRAGGYDRKEYKPVKGVYLGDENNIGKSYQEEFETGIQEAYNTFVVGNEDDFGEGVNFRTRLVIHDKKDEKLGKETYAPDQKFLQVRIGGECPDKGTEECDSNHWFHAHADFCDVLNEYSDIYIPTNEQLALDAKDKDAIESIIGYRECAAHELGHIFGLADAYYDYGLDRLIENEETCIHLKNEWTNVMEGCRKKIQMLANDFEMMLLAYGLSFEPKILIPKLVWQYYKKYELKGKTYPLSLVIRNKKDLEEERD